MVMFWTRPLAVPSGNITLIHGNVGEVRSVSTAIPVFEDDPAQLVINEEVAALAQLANIQTEGVLDEPDITIPPGVVETRAHRSSQRAAVPWRVNSRLAFRLGSSVVVRELTRDIKGHARQGGA
jgi:hypothetical protein